MASAPDLLIAKFEEKYNKTPDVYRAPGRVNLIGEHTDYNSGFVLPIAIDLACYAASVPNADGILRVHSTNFEETREFPVAHLSRLEAAHHWSDYVVGIARQLGLQRGYDVMIESEVPIGSGLSSSAAIEVSSALALGWDLEGGDRLELAKICRAAENEFVGLPSGIMDQYISVFGRDGMAVLIDCRSLENRPVPLPDVALVAVNTMVKHELGQSAYRERVAQCRAAVAAIQEHDPSVHTLRDAREDQLHYIADPVTQRRARHVITEDARVLEFEKACAKKDVAAMGDLFLQSHRSLQHDYEVSCAELDFLVDSAMRIDGVYGARMTGGGFGGCTINLLKLEAVEAFSTEIRRVYQAQFSIDAPVFPVRPSAGASRV